MMGITPANHANVGKIHKNWRFLAFYIYILYIHMIENNKAKSLVYDEQTSWPVFMRFPV